MNILDKKTEVTGVKYRIKSLKGQWVGHLPRRTNNRWPKRRIDIRWEYDIRKVEGTIWIRIGEDGNG